jgi:Protein of unknown function (DUF2799)
MNGSFIKLSAALVLVGSLSGCASLSKSECLAADWEDIGVRDGANGHAEEYLIQHAKACAKVDVVPDRGAWQRGRERGLERYCVPRRAYQSGEYGSGFNLEQCVSYDQQRLEDAWRKGNDVHRLSNDLGSIDSEIRSIHASLDNDETLERKERERLAYRLGQLGYERVATRRAYEDALERARDL